MGKVVKRRVFPRCQIGPHQPPGDQILATVADEPEKRLIRFCNAVELPVNHAGNGRGSGNRTGACPAAAQLFISFMTIAEVAYCSRKALQISILIFDRRRNGIGPESRPLFFQMPAFLGEMAVASYPFELFPQGPRIIFAEIEERQILADSLIGPIAVDAFRTRIPSDDFPVHPTRKTRTLKNVSGAFKKRRKAANGVESFVLSFERE
jgi:hypothetical protein